MDREQKIKKFGVEIVENDERVWQERGYKVDSETGLLTEIQKEAIKKPCPHCEIGKLHEVDGQDTGFGDKPEQYLHCDNCLLSMDGSGGYTY